MKTWKTFLIMLFAVLAFTGAAEAVVDLWTPPLLVPGGSDIVCLLFNTSSRPITAEISIYSFQGGLVLDSRSFTLDPKAFTTFGYHAATDDQGTCKFTVPSKTFVRGSAQTSGSAGVVVPAQ